MSDLDDEELEATRKLNGANKKSDIEILEKYIKKLKLTPEELLKNDEIIKFIEYKQIQAIENLMQENKELKKENLELHKEINQRIKLKLENERCADKDFIPKSKVKEKIEEIEMLKKIDSSAKYSHLELLQYGINQLQELLEEGE